MKRYVPVAVDRLKVFVVVDNYIDDALPESPAVRRHRLGKDGRLPIDSYLAEHALCLLLTATAGAERHQLVLDAACTPVALPHNLRFGQVELDGVAEVVISHGHEDHMGALAQLLRETGAGTRVYVHPGAFHSPRYYRTDDGELLLEPVFKRDRIASAGAEVVETPGPAFAGEGVFLITGRIPRRTAFEKALPGSMMLVDGRMVPDPIIDDQAVVVRLRDHGLVVLTGCAHAGVINTVRYARELTGCDEVWAVIGGFHLAGVPFQPALQPTIEALAEIDPRLIIPMHCTGVEAKALMHRRFPEGTLISGVGSTFIFPA